MRKNVSNKFLKIARIYAANGYNVYLAGGSARDFILGRETNDLDLASEATVEEALRFLTEHFDIGTTFRKFGNLRFKIDDVLVDITTFRKESEYDDARHPSRVTFVKDIEIDSNRRDFTINALYLDNHLDTIYDYHEGVEDLVSNTIRMIGDPAKRITEDPLRLFRALRFSLKLNYKIEEKLETVIRESIPLIAKLNPQKVKEEILKMFSINELKARELLDCYGISIDL